MGCGYVVLGLTWLRVVWFVVGLRWCGVRLVVWFVARLSFCGVWVAVCFSGCGGCAFSSMGILYLVSGCLGLVLFEFWFGLVLFAILGLCFGVVLW